MIDIKQQEEIFIAIGRHIRVILTFLNKHSTVKQQAVIINFIKLKGAGPYCKKKAIIGFTSTTCPFPINSSVK
mgnify:CR=1 FL=1